ncbi:hypothetical protein ACPSKX_04055 [Moritella viscosa]
MKLNKENILKIIIIPILLLGLSGCFEHTNDACIKKAEDVKITYKSCKDQNKFLTETNFHVLDAERTPYYDTSGGLSSSEVKRLNNNAINAEHNLTKLHEVKVYVADIILSFIPFAAQNDKKSKRRKTTQDLLQPCNVIINIFFYVLCCFIE